MVQIGGEMMAHRLEKLKKLIEEVEAGRIKITDVHVDAWYAEPIDRTAFKSARYPAEFDYEISAVRLPEKANELKE